MGSRKIFCRVPRAIDGSLFGIKRVYPYERVIPFEGGVRNILSERLRFATVLSSLLSQPFDCVPVFCVIDAV